MSLYHLPRRRCPLCIFTRSGIFYFRAYRRHLSSAPENPLPGKQSNVAPKEPHFLPNAKQRLGKCISFGLNHQQIQEASKVAKILAKEWKGLLVGPMGYRADRGLVESVRWGEMVCTWTICRSDQGVKNGLGSD